MYFCLLICLVIIISVIALYVLQSWGLDGGAVAGRGEWGGEAVADREGSAVGSGESYADYQHCLAYPPNYLDLSCLDYMQSCHNAHYMQNIVQPRDPEKGDFTPKDQGKTNIRNDILSKMRVGTDNGRALGGCAILYRDFKNFEIDQKRQCPLGSTFMGVDKGCVVQIGARNAHKKRDITVGKLSIGIERTTYKDALTEIVDTIDDWYFKPIAVPRTILGQAVSFGLNMPGTDNPRLQNVLAQYGNWYNTRLNAFRNADFRGGYIMGKIVEDNKEKKGIMPVLQKKFRGRYYTLFYKYTVKAGLKALEDKEETIGDLFIDNNSLKDPKPRMEIMSDFVMGYPDLNEFVTTLDGSYRSKYLMDFMKKNKVRFSIILQVFNSESPDPLFSMELFKYSGDGEKIENISKIFTKYRVAESEFTSNKKMMMDQPNIRCFQIDCGEEQAWTIGYVDPKRVDCGNHPVYFTIPSGSSCNWQEWLKGYVIVTNGDAINLAGNLGDFEQFKKKHMGEYMLMWMCAEHHDPFQNIQMTKDNINPNPFAMENIFFRKPNQTDDAWALNIWMNMSGDKIEAAKFSEGYKEILEKIRGKDEMAFEDYISLCKRCMSGVNYVPFAKTTGCF